MKNIGKKLISVLMSLIIFSGMQTAYAAGKEIIQDEFYELENVYESKAPTVEVAELSSTFTSNNLIEVYVKTDREDIKRIVISGWSGGPYEQYLVSKDAKFDELRNVYTVSFALNEIVNTTTNQIDESSENLYYFDACVYSTNGSMSYLKLDAVQYVETGFTAKTTTDDKENKVIEIQAEKDGYVAILNAGEEVTENTNWQPVSQGINTCAIPANETEATGTNQVQVLYKAGTEVEETETTSTEVTVAEEPTGSEEIVDNSMFQDNEMFTFEYSQNSGKNDWISYTDTPNILESTIQGMPDTEAVATITIHTEYPGTLSFDYMVSSEEEFDGLLIKINGIEQKFEYNGVKTKIISGQQAWKSFYYDFSANQNEIVFEIVYKKDFNVNRGDDKAAIRNLTFVQDIPQVNGTVSINNNEEVTNNSILDLTLTATGVEKMYISEKNEKPSTLDANWQEYKNALKYTLSDSSEGAKTIYVWYMNAEGTISIRPITDSIKLDINAPTQNAPKLESTSNTITAYLNQIDANEFVSVYYGYRIKGSTEQYIWSENVRVNDLSDVSTYIITGLLEMQEYEVVTQVYDGANDAVVSEVATIKTKIPSDEIIVTKSTEEKTLGEVVVNIEWNNTEYTKEYSLDGESWTTETENTTTITLTENAIVYYRIKNDTYDTGILKCEVTNIDHIGPQVEKIEVISPVTGTYGIDDEIIIQLTWDEEATVITAPKLVMGFEDGNTIELTSTKQTETTLTYKYTIIGTDAGYLRVKGLNGGLIKDTLNNEAVYTLPELTGYVIFVENAVFVPATGRYYGTLQRAIDVAGTNEVVLQLIANSELRETVKIKEGQKIKLDLNGKTISYESEENIVTAFENSGILEIYDSTTEKLGNIIAISQDRSAYAVVNNPTGNLIIKDIKIEAVSNSDSISLESYAVYNKGAGTITLGINDGNVSLSKPELKATSNRSYGFVNVNENGRINWYDGLIKGNKKAINMSNSMATYNMPAGYFEKTENITEDTREYQIAYLSNEATVELTLNGITNGYKSIFDALDKIPRDGRLGKIKVLSDILLEDTLKIYNGQNVEIDLNGHILTKIENSYSNAYGIKNNGTLRLESTTVGGEINVISKKNVYVYVIYNYSLGDLIIDNVRLFGKIDLVKPTKAIYGVYGGTVNNKIKIIEGEIWNTIFLNTKYVETIDNKYLNQRKETINGIEYKINYISEEPVVKKIYENNVYYYSSLVGAIESVNVNDELSKIIMLKDEEFFSTIEIKESQYIEIDLNGKSLYFKNNSCVTNKGNLIIRDDSIEQSGNIEGTTYGIYNDGNGILEVISGAIIVQASASNTYSYGIYQKGEGTLKINGGYTDLTSYGIYIYNANSTVFINGGRWKGKNIGIYIPQNMEIVNSNTIVTGKINLLENRNITHEIEEDYYIGFVADGDCVVELNFNGVTTKYKSICDAIENVLANGMLAKIKMYQNEILLSKLEIVEGQNIEIDLNGKVISSGNDKQPLVNKGTLLITDNSEGKNGKIINVIENQEAYTIYNDSNAVLNILSGNISGGKYAVYNKEYGEVIVKDGNIQSSYGVYNVGEGNIVIDGGKIQATYGIYNNGNGNIVKNGGKIISSTAYQTYGIYNNSTGKIKINGGEILNYYGIYNKAEGFIEIDGGLLNIPGYGIYNESNGRIKVNSCEIITTQSVSGYGIFNKDIGMIEIDSINITSNKYGIYNNGKGTVRIGENDGIIKNDIQIFGRENAIYLNTVGSFVCLYDGILKSEQNCVYPVTTVFEKIETASETQNVINIPEGTEIIEEINDTVKETRIKYKEGYIADKDIIDEINPYVINIEVINPDTGEYAKGQNIFLKVNYSEDINAQLETVPYLKIKFDGEKSKEVEPYELGNSYIIYKYVISEEDKGFLKLVSYTDGNVTDINNNNWVETYVELIGNEIKAKTIAYIPEKNKYYCSLKDAIEDCDINASEYTKIKLIDEELKAFETVEIKESQKIEIDLNGNELKMNYAEKAILNNGDLRIIDSSILKKNKITIFGGEVTNGNKHNLYFIYNEGSGNVELEDVNLNINARFPTYTSTYSKAYGIYNKAFGKISLQNTNIEVSASSNTYGDDVIHGYGIYNNNGYVIVEDSNITVNVINGYGIYISGGELTIDGGEITAKSSAEAIASYGIYISNKGSKVQLFDGTWKGEVNGIYIPSGMFINNSNTILNGAVNIPFNMSIAYEYVEPYVLNYLKEGAFSVEVEKNGITEKYNSLQEALSKIEADGSLAKIKLLQSESIGISLNVLEGQNIELDLNGKEIFATNVLQCIINSGNLKITDNSNEKSGRVTQKILGDVIINSTSSNTSYAVLNKGTGNLIIEDGIITAEQLKNNIGSSRVYGIYNSEKGNVIINGGEIHTRDNASDYNTVYTALYNNGGVVEINEGILTGEQGVYCNSGELTINGGELKGQEYGIYINTTNSTINLYGGEYKGIYNGIYKPSEMFLNNLGIKEQGKINILQNNYINCRKEDAYVVNFLSEGDFVVEVIYENVSTKYLSILDAIKNIEANGLLYKIKLLKNESVFSTINILENHNIEIDLNGKMLCTGINGELINNNGVLKVFDTSNEIKGKLTAKGTVIKNSGVYDLLLENFIIESGTINNNNTGKIEMNKITINAGSVTQNKKGNLVINECKINSTGIAITNSGSEANIIIDNSEIVSNGGTYISTIKNSNTGNIIIKNSKVELEESADSYAIYNSSSGAINLENSTVYASGSGWVYAIYNSGTGNIEITRSEIFGEYGMYFRNSSSYFYFKSGKIISRGDSISPTSKIIDVDESKYVRKYKENINGSTYNVATVAEMGKIKVINKGDINYYNQLNEAIAAAPNDNSLTQIIVLKDGEHTSGGTITSGKNILLDLNGKNTNITNVGAGSTYDYVKVFTNDGIFEIMDSVGNGNMYMESPKATTYGIYINSGSFKLYDANITVTSVGSDIYGLYCYKGDHIIIEKGCITSVAEKTNSMMTTGKAYGIYMRGGVRSEIKGENASIVAFSELNNSYGYYSTQSETLTLGTQDGTVNNQSPYIVGGTAGIYKTQGKINMYDGAITGPTGASVTKTIDVVEDDAVVYVKDNQDGTETTMLLKEVKSIEVEPTEIYFSQINDKQDLSVIYLPVDATDVSLNYTITDENVATVRTENDNYIIVARANGYTEITFTATDVLGNQVSGLIKVHVDDLPPTDTAPAATSTGTTITIICNQKDSHGLNENATMYAISSDGGTTWSDWTNRSTITNLESNTEYVVKTKVSDKAGNETESQTTTIRTKLPNNSTFVLEPDSVTKENVKVTITWNNNEGIPQYYSVDGSTWTLTNEDVTEIAVTENNKTVYTKLVYDGGEESNINYVIVDNIDRLIPSGSITEIKDISFDGIITANITGSDDACVEGDLRGAVAYIYLTTEELAEAPSATDEGWIRWNGNGEYTAQVFSEGTYTLYAWLRDKAGNTSNVLVSEQIEYIPPVVVLYEDGKVVDKYDTIAEAYTVARVNNSNPSTIKVYKDHTMTTQLTIANTKNIILDLNGKKVSSTLATAITNNGKLEITDSLGNGVFTNTMASSYVYAIYNNKTLKISGGTIETRNTTSGSYRIYGVYNNGSAATMEMTDGKIYVTSTRSSSSSSYYACGIYNYSSYTTKDSLVITGGTVEVDALEYAYAYGIWNSYNGRAVISNADIIVNSEKSYAYGINRSGSGSVTFISGNIDVKSASSTGYAISNSTSTASFTIGANDGNVSTTSPVISGSTYGVYRSYGTINFYDGIIKGKENNSIVHTPGYVITPEYYGIEKSVTDGVEVATLVYDNIAPNVGEVVITNNTDVNIQTVTAKNVTDEGMGIIGYILSTSTTVPTKISTNWTTISKTTGPIEISKNVSENGTWNFWVIDAAGNVSEGKSVVAENIKVKATDATLSSMNVILGTQQKAVLTLTPATAEPKSITYTSSNPAVAYVDATTGMITGKALGSVTLTATILNYDNTTIIKTATVTIAESIPEILTEPLDRTVIAGTTTEFIVDAVGTNMSYQWYEVNDGNVTAITENHNKIYKSNIEGQASSTATETIILNTNTAGTLSFDYMVSSESTNDTFTVTIVDANGTTTAVNGISGEVDWTSYSKDVTPTGVGTITITLTYAKNGSVDAGLDFGAIRNLKYYYYGVVDATSTFESEGIFEIVQPATITDKAKGWKIETENGTLIFRNDNASIHSSSAKATIIIRSKLPGTLSFDYKYGSESSCDKATIKVIDKDGTTTVINLASGTKDWTAFTKDVTPDGEEITITLEYTKDSSVDRNGDIAAIRNLKYNFEGYVTEYSTFTSDSLYTLSNNFEAVGYTGATGATLTVPGAMVIDDISGTKYYCDISNSAGTVTTRQATLTVAEEAIETESQMPKTAPTLEVGFKQITATSNQIGENVVSTKYAISTDNVTFAEWQDGNVFTNLIEGQIYYVKTKVTNDKGEEQESLASFALIPSYVASLTENGNTTYYENVQDAITASTATKSTEQDVVTMLKDETRTSQVTVSSAKNILLDLNGKQILVSNSGYINLYAIYNQGKLEVKDSVGNGKIICSLPVTSSYYAYGVYNYGGTFTLTSGHLEAVRPTNYAQYAYGIYNYNSSSIATIGNAQDAMSTTSPTITSTGYGVYRNNGTVNFYDGLIRADIGKTTYGTINPLTNYLLKTETVGLQDIAYLGEPQTIVGAKVTLDQTSFAYDGKAKTPTAKVVFDNKILTLNTDYTVSYDDNIDAGTAKLIVTGKGKFKDSITSNFEITVATPTITLTNKTEIYTSNKISINAATVAGVTGGSVPTGEITYTYYIDENCETKTNAANSGTTAEGDAPVNVGTYYVKATIAKDGNYGIATSNVATLEITEKAIIVPVASNKIYNAETQYGIMTGTGFSVTGNASAIDVGTYKGTVTPTSNYMWEDGTKVAKEFEWTISPYEVSVTWGSRVSFIYDGTAKIPTVTTPIDGAGEEKINISVSGDKIDVGTGYVATAAIGSVTGGQGKASNYTLKDTTREFEITRKSVGLPVITNKIYNGATQAGVEDGLGYTLTGTSKAIDAGTYTAKATLTSNYIWSDGTIEDKTLEWTISPYTITVFWSGNTSFVYDGLAKAPIVSSPIAGLRNEKVNISVDGAKVNVGTDYIATAYISSVTDGQENINNYKLTNDKKMFSITKAIPKLTLSAESGKAAFEVVNSFTVTSTAAGTLSVITSAPEYISIVEGNGATVAKDGAVTIKYKGIKAMNSAETISIVFTPTDTLNYQSASATYTVDNIEKVASSLSSDITTATMVVGNKVVTTLTYVGDGSLDVISNNTGIAKVTVSNKVTNGNTTTATITIEGIAKGTTSVKVTTKGENYLDNELTIPVTVNSKNMSATDLEIRLSEDSYIYDGTEKKPTITIKDTTRNITLVEGTDYTIKYENNKDVGTAKVTITGAGNYTGSIIKTYEITRKGIKVPTASNSTYNGVNQVGVTTGTGYTITGTASAIDAGTYTATVTPNSNYMWEDGTAVAKSLEWTIAPYSITVTWDSNTNFVYTGSAQAPVATSPINGVNGEKITLQVSGKQVNVGSNYTATASITGVVGGQGKVANYELKGYTKAFSIGEAAIVVKLNNYTGEYDGLSHKSPLTVEAPLGEIKVYYSTSTPLNSGNYSTAGSLVEPSRTEVGTTNIYYYVHDVTGNYTDYASNANNNDAKIVINKKSAKITAKPQTILYGESVESGVNYVSVENLLEGHSLKTVTLTPSITNAGNGGITPTNAVIVDSNNNDVTSNYEIKYVAGTLVIERIGIAKPSISGTYTYTGALQTVKLENFDSSKMNVENNTRTDAGAQVVTISLRDTANYKWSDDNSIANVSLAWKIEQKLVTVEWSNTVLKFNGLSQAPTAKVETGINGEKINMQITGQQTNAGNNYTAKVGSFTVTGGQANAGNYKLENDSVKFEILINSAMSFEIIVDDENVVYNGQPQKPSVKIKVTIDGNTFTLIDEIDYELAYSNNTNVGMGTVKVTGLGNYAGITGTAQFEIKEETLKAPRLTAKEGSSQGEVYTSDTWSKKDVWIRLENPNISRVETYEWSTSKDSGFTSEGLVMSNQQAVMLIKEEGIKTLYFRIKRADGTYSEVISIIVKIDKTSPDGSIDIGVPRDENGIKHTNKQIVTLRLSAADNVADKTEMKMCVMNEDQYEQYKKTGKITWIPFVEEMEWELTPGDGGKIVYVLFKDGAGNLSIYSE